MKTNMKWVNFLVAGVVLSVCSIVESYPPPILIPDGRSTPEPTSIPYRITTLPNSRSPEGIMAIVPAKYYATESRAASLAAFQLRRYSKQRLQRWRRLYIFVFKDAETAEFFNRYQTKRKNAPLQNADYIKLQTVWPSTLVRYEYRNKKEYVLYPSKNPRGWWKAKTR